MSLKRSRAKMRRVLAALSPRPIVSNADSADVLNRAGHIEAVYTIVMAYLDDVLHDTMDHRATVGDANECEIEHALWGAVNRDPDYDVVAWLSRAGCSLALPAAA